MAAIDDVIKEHAEKLQRVYDERTAGDGTFVGALAMFLIDVEQLPNVMILPTVPAPE